MSIGTTSDFIPTSEYIKLLHRKRCKKLAKLDISSFCEEYGLYIQHADSESYLSYMLSPKDSERILTKIKEHDDSNYRR